MSATYGARWRARGDHSPSDTPTAAVALFLYSRVRHTSSSIWLSLLVFSLSLCISLSSRVSSLPALCSRLCRHSALFSVGVLPRHCLCSALYSAPVSALLLSHLCLGYASRSSRATSTSLHSSLSNHYRLYGRRIATSGTCESSLSGSPRMQQRTYFRFGLQSSALPRVPKAAGRPQASQTRSDGKYSEYFYSESYSEYFFEYSEVNTF